MNTWQFYLSNWQWVVPVWAIFVSFVYTGLLVWAMLMITLSHNHTSLIFLSLEIFSVTCILLSVCLYGWSNSNVFLIHLPIRTVSGDHMQYWEKEKRTLEPCITGEPSWSGDLIWKGRGTQTPPHIMRLRGNNSSKCINCFS